jgi:nitric oxide reductase NorD protein
MADAEDVVLSAAEHVVGATRALWERGRRPAEAASAAGRRRLDCWLAAAGGRAFEVVEVDPPPAAGWLRRVLARPAPWQLRPVELARSDGRTLYLPRGAAARLGASRSAADLLPALVFALRVPSLSRALPAAARDLGWILEGACIEAELARAFPGLAGELAAARTRARAARPGASALRSAERAVEAIAQALLQGSPARGAEEVARLVEGAASPLRIRDFALRFAAALPPEALRSYRGVAPIPHWGALELAPPPDAVASGPPPSASQRRTAGRRLGRRVARRAPEPAAARPGPFLPPPGDPHGSVQDARGLDRPLDRGDEALDPLAEELSRLRELPVVDAEGPVREILEDAGGARPRAGRAAGSAAGAILYPEWDHRSGTYRPGACAVRECPQPAPARAPAPPERSALLRRVRRQFEALRPRRQRVPRRLDGDGIDLDAWALEHAERRARSGSPGRLYTEERPARRDVAVALLVDASGSTDAWITKHRRVIDVAKEAALCFCDALAALGDRVGVYAFSGQGPRDVRVWVPKRFADRDAEQVRARIDALEPDRFTRLGGPVRHVTAELARVAARVRVLLLLSDGKPNDEDDYEGEYGVEDVRQAVAEARAVGVQPFCLTIDREGPSYLPRIFGPAGYTVLWDVEQLPLRLPRLYRRLTSGA